MSTGWEPLQIVSTLSAPYSGATLLAILLNRHSAISSDGETFPVERGKRMTCSCGERQVDCEYYRATASHMLFPTGDDWDRTLFAHVPRYSRIYPLDRALGGFWMSDFMNVARNQFTGRLPWWRQEEDRFLDAHARFIAKSLRVRSAKIYVDGSKSFRRAELLARSERFTCKAIHLIRDGRAFANSFLKNKSLPPSELSTAAARWRRNIQKVDLFRQRFPAMPFLQVRYEDLCREPQETLASICTFLELENQPALTEINPDSYHVIGNRMRMTFSGKVRFDQAWQQTLDSDQIAEVTEALRPELACYGYLDRRSRESVI